MNSAFSWLWGRISAGLFVVFERRACRMDALKAEEAGTRLGRALWKFPLAKKQRTRALENLALVFPELSEAQRIDLAKRTFEHFGRVTYDFLRTTKRTEEEVLESIEVTGTENVRAAMDKDRGVLGITAHFGNWERFAHWGAASKWNLTVVARDANDKDLHKHVLRIRESLGIEVISRGQAARPILKKLAQKGVVAMLPDQNSSEGFITFFGKPCGTVLGPAILAKKTGAPLMSTFCVRVGPCRYKMIVFPMIEGVEDKTPEEIMTELNQALEKVVREYPDQYLWFHDRYKSARRTGLL